MSWKTTDTEDSAVNGGEILLIENESGNGNNWISLNTIKTWLSTFFAATLGADDNYVTDSEKIIIGNTSGTNTGDNAVNTNYSSLVTMTYPGAGIPVSTGSAWGTSISASANGQSLISAANYAAMRVLLDLEPGVDYDSATPSILNLTTDTAITEAQLLAYKYISNLGASGAVTATLPVITYPLTRTFLSSAAQVLSVKPPSGATLDTTITPVLDTNDKVSLPATIHSKLVVTSVPVGAGWVWSVDSVRGTLTDGGA